MPAAPLRPVWQWLVYGHLWLAACAAAQVGWTGLFMADAPELWRYSVAVALGTFAGYGVMRLARARSAEQVHYANLTWYSQHRKSVTFLVAVAAVLAFVLMWPLWPRLWQWLLPVGVLAFFYVTPFSDRKGNAIGLRSIPFVKTWLISALWVIVTVAVPLRLDEQEHSAALELGMACMRLPLILSLSIAFDIRDLHNDPPSLRTMPQLFGMRGAKVLAIALLFASAALESLFLRGLDYVSAMPVMFLGYAYALVLIVRAKPVRDPIYYALLIDGVMVLIPVCVWVGTRL